MLCSCAEPEKLKLRIDLNSVIQSATLRFSLLKETKTLVQNLQALPWGPFYNSPFYEFQTKSSVKKWSSCRPPPAELPGSNCSSEHLEKSHWGLKPAGVLCSRSSPLLTWPHSPWEGLPRAPLQLWTSTPQILSSSAFQTFLFPPASTNGNVELFYTTGWGYYKWLKINKSVKSFLPRKDAYTP